MPAPAVRVKVTMENIRQWTDRLKGKLNAEFVPRIMQAAQEQAKPRVLPILINAFEETQAVQGILGRVFDQDKDVQAHLGIENPAQTWGEMVEAITKSLRVRRTTLGLTVFATNIVRNLEKIPSGTYESFSRRRASRGKAFGDASGGGGIYIDWMHWLISGESRFMNYHIEFTNDPASRSGRALMRPGEGKNGEPLWNIEDYHAFAEKDTFVHDALEGEEWPLEIQRAVVKLIKDICLKNRR